MYKVMLAPGNTEFVSKIDRNIFRHRSDSLRVVVEKLEIAQRSCTQLALSDLLTALHNWSDRDPNEYANRGGTEGVAYRLWMEAKQLLRNQYHMNANARWPDPAKPANCPGICLLGIYVPPAPEGQQEICHLFAYRWAIAAGKIAENPAFPAAQSIAFNGMIATPVLYPAGVNTYPSARTNGAIMVNPGDIIAMYEPLPNGPSLGHSLIAVTQTNWFGANNVQTFGTPSGRTAVTLTACLAPAGWVGDTNQWHRAADPGIAHVVYRRIP